MYSVLCYMKPVMHIADYKLTCDNVQTPFKQRNSLNMLVNL